MSETNGPRVIEIDLDRPRKLRVDMNAFAAAEELTGKNLLAREAWQSLTSRDLRAVVWACLRHEDAELTLEQVGAMLHPGSLADVAEAFGSLWPDKPAEGEGSAA